MFSYDESFLEELRIKALEFLNVDVKNVIVKFVESEVLNKHKTSISLLTFGQYTRYNNTVLLNKNVEILSMLSCFFHEMTHFRQYEEGRLENIFDDEGILTHFLYEGIHYDYDYPYAFRPWEIEADQEAGKSFKEFVKAAGNTDFLVKLLDEHKKGMI